jgi:hypothetical protein
MVAVQVAVCMAALCGVTAFAIDGGVLLENRRRVLATTDAAALAAADDLYVKSATNHGVDVNGAAAASARLTVSSNGFSANSTTTVNIPPLSGPYTGKAGYAEVILVYQMTRGFSSIFGSGTLPIQARSVARGLPASTNDAIILLDPTGQLSMGESGNASVNVGTSNIIVDSSSSKAVSLSGNATVTAAKTLITGGYSVTGGGAGFSGTVTTGATPTADPLATIAAPTIGSLTVQSSNQYTLTGGTTTLNPGVYTGGISLSGQASVVLNPGIYYLNGGGLSLSGGASISGSGVMFYNDPGSGNGQIDLAGHGSVTISPPTSGIYQGISIFQNRTATTGVTISGSGSVNMTGTFYVPMATINVTGNGSSNTVGSQYISSDLTIAGNGAVNLSGIDATSASTRQLGLVE